ncbi:MAG: hypothetical protein MK052_11595, partial [Alphaproteobacteria bacterium]|nr:hypothetical protein [Alphaproteobacteria bacterium]
MKYRLLSLATLFVVVCFTSPVNAEDKKTAMQFENPLEEALYHAVQKPAGHKHGNDMQRFYKERNYQPVWMQEDGDWARSPKDVIEAINSSDKEGLKPENYPLASVIDQAPSKANVQAVAQYELRVTDQVMDFVKAVRYGQVMPSKVFPKFFTPDDSRDLAYPLQQIIESSSIEAGLQEQAPQMPEYA